MSRVKEENTYQTLLNKLHDVRIEGRSITELFTEVPSAEMYPDYREVVATPISLAEISKRVSLNAYDSDDQILDEFELMADNARQYNGDQSPVFEDAVDILDYATLYLKGTVSKITMQQNETLILDELENYKYKGRKLSDAFIVEPDAETYPNYRDVVKNPSSFTKVRAEFKKKGLFNTWEEFRRAVELMFDNAMLFNLEGSPIYNDAKSLKKQLDTKIKKYSPVPKHLKSALEIDNEDESEDEMEVDEPPQFKSVKYDDDDDDDFEAESDDLDEEDEGLDPEDQDQDHEANEGMPMPGPDMSQMQPAVVYDELVYRPPGETSENAMIKMVTCNSMPIPHQLANNYHIEDVKKAENDLVQIKVLPSETKAFTTYATTLPYYQSTLRLAVQTNELQTMQLHVLLNGAKLGGQQQGNMEYYELTLAPGLNQISIIAIKPNLSGFIRPYGPPPLADAEEDEERMILFVNLSK